MQILQNVLHSLTKRKKQAGKVTVTAAVAAVFIAVIVVSANGILSYQKAVTKKTFGGWFIMENSSNGTQSEELKTHPYLAGSGKAVNTAVYSVSELSSTEIKIGYMDSMAAQLASLTLLKGAMPQNNDEIAVERHTLETLGYSEELGQTITVSYPDKNNKTSIFEKQLTVREYTLTGVLEDYAAYWDSGSYMPVMLVTQIEAENYAQTESVTTLYALNEDIHTADYRQIYQGMYKASTADTKLIYNSKTYDSHETDFGKMSFYAGCFALAAGIFVTAAVLWTYQRERRTAYRQFERMGMTRFCRAWYRAYRTVCVDCTVGGCRNGSRHWNRVADSVDFVTAAECTGTAYADCLWQCGGMDGGFLCDNGFVGTVCGAKSGQGKAEKEAVRVDNAVRTACYKSGIYGYCCACGACLHTKNVGGTESIHP